MSITRELAEFVAETRYAELPEAEATHLKHLGLKTAVGTVVGATERTGRRLMPYLEEAPAGTTPVIGTGVETNLSDAVLANATLAHASELEDDSSVPHQGISWDVTTFPLTLTLTDKYRPSGAEFLAASVASLETLNRLCRVIPYRASASDVVIRMGSVAAAVAAARSMRLDREEIENALGMALGGGFVFMPNTGTDAHFFDSGFQCLRGYLAARLAGMGFTGNADFEGYFDAFFDGHAPVDELTDGLGTDWTFTDIDIKKYPCCFLIHRHADIMREVVAERDLSPADIKGVTVEAGVVEDRTCNRPDPTDPDDAKFSYQHVLGSILLDGFFGFEHLSADVVRDDDYGTARELVDVSVDPDWEVRFQKPAILHVDLASGETITRRREHMVGSVEDPLSDGEMTELVRRLTVGILSERAAERTAERFLELDRDKDALEVLEGIAG